MKILSLNLNHRTNSKLVPDQFIDLLTKISPDVICLNEFVYSKKQLHFLSNLKALGYSATTISDKKDFKHNQILIASKQEHQRGHLTGPATTDHCEPNFLHVRLADNLNIVGLRVPSLKGENLIQYWKELHTDLEQLVNERTIIVGDFNCDPFTTKSKVSILINGLKDLGFNIPKPVGQFSYINSDGSSTSCIDHTVTSKFINIFTCEYLDKVDDIVIAGKKIDSPIIDHCALVIEFR